MDMLSRAMVIKGRPIRDRCIRDRLIRAMAMRPWDIRAMPARGTLIRATLRLHTQYSSPMQLMRAMVDIPTMELSMCRPLDSLLMDQDITELLKEGNSI